MCAKLKKKQPKVKVYRNFDTDFRQTPVQDKPLKIGYDWEKRGAVNWVKKQLAYGFAISWAFLYVYVYKRVKLPLRAARRPLRERRGVCVYSNHTMTFQDVLAPLIYCFPKRPQFICSAANLGVPILGKILPYVGALPIPGSVHEMARFNDYVISLLQRGKTIMIYPEAHLWPFCTFIRPFSAVSFRFPAAADVPVFAMTTTFFGKKSGRYGVKLEISGKITSDKLKIREKAADLAEKVRSEMEMAAKNNTFVKYIYRKQG